MTDPRTGPGRETLSDGAEAVPLAVLTQHTLCPLLTDVLDDRRGNGHAQFGYAPAGPVSFLSGPIEEGETLRDWSLWLGSHRPGGQGKKG